MTVLKKYVFVGVDTKTTPPHILTWSARSMASECRDRIGLAYEGWSKAHKCGIRIKRATVEVEI